MIKFVRHLNKPFSRTDLIIEAILGIIDSIIMVTSLGYIWSNFKADRIRKTMKVKLAYLEDEYKNDAHL